MLPCDAVMMVLNSVGKLLSCVLFVDPEGPTPSAADSAFANLGEADWRILTYVRFFVFQLTAIIFSQLPCVLAVAAAWPASFEGHRVTLALMVVGHVFGSLPFWAGVTGHFVLTSAATMSRWS